MLETKKEWRLKMRSFLATLSSDEVLERSKSLSSFLHKVIKPKSHLLWGVFAPLSHEPRWDVCFGDVGMKFAYPASLVPGEMDFFLCARGQLSESRGFGVKIPCPPTDRPKVQPQALLVPALAYSFCGGRLGQGGGYYDRVLSTYGGVRVGVCFDEQLSDHLPLNDHDQGVQVVVTDKRVVSCEAKGQDKDREDRKQWI